MSALPPYPAYKDSGVEWVGAIPATFTLRRVGDLAEIINGFPFDAALFGNEGFPLVRIRDLNARETATRYGGAEVPSVRVTKADVLVGMDGDFNVGRWRGEEPALLNQRMLAIRAAAPLDRFLEFALPFPLERINAETYATTVKHLSSAQVRAIRVPVPSDHADLLALVGYLDRETAEIDAFIADQEELIGLLTERRAATITHAVTKGLDPSVPMKDSGVEWSGAIPADWGMRKLSQLFAAIGSGTTPPKEPRGYYGGEIPWVTTGELREAVITSTRETVTRSALRDLSALRLYPAGSILIAMYGATIGRLGILGISATTNQACCALVHPSGVHPKFVYYALHAAREHLVLLADGGGQPNINQDKMRQLRIPLPPLEDQHRVVLALDYETAELDSAIADAREAIALSRERRAALISAAVTGKIDVRGAA